jgi:hypothetical protein
MVFEEENRRADYRSRERGLRINFQSPLSYHSRLRDQFGVYSGCASGRVLIRLFS